jgi:hypothetical protein
MAFAQSVTVKTKRKPKRIAPEIAENSKPVLAGQR